jgi:signal transduction histidine kinase
MEQEIFIKAFNDARNRGVGLRCIIEITNGNLDLCRKLMELVEIHHLDGFEGNFLVNKRKYLAINATALQELKTVPQVAYINVKQIVEQQKYIFDILWNKTISAKERIGEIENGVITFNTIILRDLKHVESLFSSQIQHARSEILFAVSSITYLERLASVGLEDSIKQAKSKGVNIMILCSEEDRSDVVAPSYTSSAIKRYAQIRVTFGIQGTILLVDNSTVLTITDEDGTSAIAVCSNNKSLVKNFGSLLDSLWNETEMLESIIVVKDNLADSNKQLQDANKKLESQDKMQKDFINVAAHELRTPLTPIIGYAELLEIEQEQEQQEGREAEIGEKDNNVKRNYIKAIIRNTKRLEELSEHILDVTRIESKILNLNKERLNLDDVIINAIDDLKIYSAKDPEKKENLKVRYEPRDGNIPIEADRNRMTQVISNLLNNAVKFTNEGSITIKTERKDGRVFVSIKDTGSGIDAEIMPRLFSKFGAKSDTGTGLGLFISKSIIEAHGGTICAENNKDGQRGATFTFSLPSSKQ